MHRESIIENPARRKEGSVFRKENLCPVQKMRPKSTFHEEMDNRFALRSKRHSNLVSPGSARLLVTALVHNCLSKQKFPR